MKRFFRIIGMKIKAMDGLTKAFLVAFILLSLVTSFYAFRVVNNLTRTMTILDLPGAPLLEGLLKENGEVEGASPGKQVSIATPEPWDGTSRVTILILGLEYNDWRGGGYSHSDSMILLSIDPISKKASMLSLPRDLWVSIPGFDYGRINEAHFNGDAYKLPGGGPELARQTVERFIGVPVQYVAVIDYYAFIGLIDELGGVQVKPEEYVTLEMLNSAYEEVLSPGQTVTLNGELALAYIRSRESSGGDIDRAKRQQEVIVSIRNRILKHHSIPELVAKAPALYQELSSGIYTNMNLQEAIQLGVLALQIDLNNIEKGIIGYDMVIPTKSPNGEAILKPIPDKIRVLRDQLFTTSGSKGPSASPSSGSTLVADEATRVVIWNGSGDAAIGERTAEYLRGQGINVIQVADAGSYSPGTKIEIFNGKPHTVKYLAQLMGVASANIWNTFDPNAGVDVRVTIGGDWAQNNSLP